eukprot:UC4_evm1s506
MSSHSSNGRPETSSSVRVVDSANDLAKSIRPLGLSPAQEAKFYYHAEDATFKPRLLASPIRDAATSSGYGIVSPPKKNPSDKQPENAYDDKKNSPFKSPFRDIEKEHRSTFVVETISSKAKELRKIKGDDTEYTFVPQLPQSTAAARLAATSSGYGRVPVESRLKQDESSKKESMLHSPSMEKTKKSRMAVASSGYGKIAVPAKEAQTSLPSDYTFKPDMSSSKKSQYYRQAASSGYGKVVPEKTTFEVEQEYPYQPQIKMKAKYDAPSSGYGKVLPPPKVITEHNDEDFTLDCVKFDNENRFPPRVPVNTILADQPGEAVPDDDG